MACPFLKEGRALYCRAAPFGKMILEGPGYSDQGRCESSEYYRCDLVKSDGMLGHRCPHLEEIQVQYCGVSTPSKLIPFSESQTSSCISEGYRYCESYLALSRPHGALPAADNLLYSANHFWMDVQESGACYIGIDAFLADVIGHADAVTFAATHGPQPPEVALTIHGVEWPLTFPNAIVIDKVNGHLRGDPSRLTADPYGSGWLFCGQELEGHSRNGLLSGAPAAAWQEEERQRLSAQIHNSLPLPSDGGQPVKGVGQLLSRTQLVCLLQHFFSNRGWGPRGWL
jgi:glycine cleavage system H lipoate-binding protein